MARNEIFTWHELERAVRYAIDLGSLWCMAAAQRTKPSITRVSFQSKQFSSLHGVLLQHRLFQQQIQETTCSVFSRSQTRTM